MSAAGALAALAAVAATAALWEAAGGMERGAVARRLRRGHPLLDRLAHLAGGDSRRRLEPAGLDRLPPWALPAARVLGCGAGLALAAFVAPGMPGRAWALAALALPACGLMAPDAIVAREIRRRARELAVALADALDLVAVTVQGGGSLLAGLGAVATGTRGLLADELRMALAEIDAGRSQEEAFERLGRRCPGSELRAFLAAAARSRRHGAPLAERLEELAVAIRERERIRAQERAGRAAPKIQLVVALVIVPSVLLMIAAGLIAHSDELLAGL